MMKNSNKNFKKKTYKPYKNREKSKYYWQGFDAGETAAFEYKRKDPVKSMSLLKSMFTKDYSADFTAGFNAGYYKVHKERKEQEIAQKVEQAKQETTQPVVDNSKLDDIALRQQLLDKMTELKVLQKQLEQIKDLEK